MKIDSYDNTPLNVHVLSESTIFSGFHLKLSHKKLFNIVSIRLSLAVCEMYKYFVKSRLIKGCKTFLLYYICTHSRLTILCRRWFKNPAVTDYLCLYNIGFIHAVDKKINDLNG